jgi:hypothetical protein
MKRVSNYLRMRVLGALEYAEGDTKLARYKAVSQMTFTDECGKSHQFSHKTIESWWYYYQRNGVTDHTGRSDKGTSRKVHPEYLLEAIEQVLPSFHGKKYNIAEIYRACIQRGLLQGTRIGATTFRLIVNRFKLLKPVDHTSTKARLAFAKPHANDLWQGDTLHGWGQSSRIHTSTLGRLLISYEIRNLTSSLFRWIATLSSGFRSAIIVVSALASGSSPD